MGGFVSMKRPNAEIFCYFWASDDVWRSSLQELFVIILIRCKFVHFKQNYGEMYINFAENLPLLKR